MKAKDLLSINDLNNEDIQLLISAAINLKAQGESTVLAGKTLAIVFEKPSLRTRVSFELAMGQLGGRAIYLSPAEVGLGKRESVADVARVLCRYVDAITARTFAHSTLEGLATNANIPVINALSDVEHPCQALADLLTIQEKKGKLKGIKLAYVGDGNNVAVSLMLAAAMAGMNFRIATPAGYGVPEKAYILAREYARESGGGVMRTSDAALASGDADVIYTDVWTSMGQEAETEKRRKVFTPYQVNSELLAHASEDAIFMHPLPAHRGEEVTDEVLDGSTSVVFDQAENRLHVQKAVLVEMLGSLEIPMPGGYA